MRLKLRRGLVKLTMRRALGLDERYKRKIKKVWQALPFLPMEEPEREKRSSSSSSSIFLFMIFRPLNASAFFAAAAASTAAFASSAAVLQGHASWGLCLGLGFIVFGV